MADSVSQKRKASRQRAKAGVAVYTQINEILFTYWDPIGMNEVIPRDEYEAYVGTVYRALANGVSEFGIVKLLTTIENERIGVRAPTKRKREAARRLCSLDVRLETGSPARD